MKKVDLIANLQFTERVMRKKYGPKVFFTSHMICNTFKNLFPNLEVHKWELRQLIKEPHFSLLDVCGWTTNLYIQGIDDVKRSDSLI